MISEIFLTHLAHLLVSNQIHIINIAVIAIGLKLLVYFYLYVCACLFLCAPCV